MFLKSFNDRSTAFLSLEKFYRFTKILLMQIQPSVVGKSFDLQNYICSFLRNCKEPKSTAQTAVSITIDGVASSAFLSCSFY